MIALGIDIGKVIIGDDTDGSSPAMFTQDYLKAAELPGAIETIAWLNQESPFRGQVYLVSKCGENVQRKTLAWLAAKDFSKRTSIEDHKIRFCRERADKASIARKLGLTHFVDDRLEILGYLAGVCTGGRFLFRGKEREILKHLHHLSSVECVESWEELKSNLGSVRAL